MTGGVGKLTSKRVVLVCGATLAEFTAAWLLMAHAQLLMATLCHLLASVLCAKTVDRTRSTYRDAVFVAAFGVPVLGPVLAWALLAEPDEAAMNAHAFFENYEEEVQGKIVLEATERDSGTRTISFYEVLRHGSLDHRRNALRKLAQRGQRVHLQMLRRCLSHADMELRLGAFTELNRLLRGWEERLSALRRAVDEMPSDSAGRAALSQAHREYAASGLLDEDMARFQLSKAATVCDLTMVPDADQTDLAVERAMVFAELGDLDAAVEALLYVTGPNRDAAHVCIARARIAFLTRRYGDVRLEVERLTSIAAEVPRWMCELESVTSAKEAVAL